VAGSKLKVVAGFTAVSSVAAAVGARLIAKRWMSLRIPSDFGRRSSTIRTGFARSTKNSRLIGGTGRFN
jgi:hypothetical protein